MTLTKMHFPTKNLNFFFLKNPESLSRAFARRVSLTGSGGGGGGGGSNPQPGDTKANPDAAAGKKCPEEEADPEAARTDPDKEQKEEGAQNQKEAQPSNVEKPQNKKKKKSVGGGFGSKK